MSVRDYEPPLSKEGDPLRFGKEPVLWPGVRGYAILTPRGIIKIPLITAEKEGDGAVGEMLDRLSPRCRVVCVINSKLRGMLKRRHWKLSYEGTMRDLIDVWTPPTQ